MLILGKETVTQNSAFNALSKYGRVADKRVLEVGGNSDCVAATPFAAAGAAAVEVTGLYHLDRAMATPHPAIRLDEADALKLDGKYERGSFDLVYGISILEHIPTPSVFFAQVSHVLSSGGLAFLQGSPLWTGPWGHHIHLTPWQNGTKGIYQFIPSEALIDQGAKTYNPIPDWGHILYSRVEMLDYLVSQQTPAEDLEMILDAVYNDDVINREPASAIVAAANASDLTIIEMEFDRVEVPDEVRDQLRAQYPTAPEDYSVMGVRMILRKD